MTIVVDTSIWVEMIRDKSGRVGVAIDRAAQTQPVHMLAPVRMELLQGCRGPAQWSAMLDRVSRFVTVHPSEFTWDASARIYFDLRQAGHTIRSVVDCLIAALAVEHSLQLLHDDRDFEAIATVCPLKHHRLELDKA